MNNLRKSILVSLALSIALQAYAQASTKEVNIIERQYKSIKGDIKLLIQCFKTKKCDKEAQKALARLSAKTLALIGMIVGISAGAYMLRRRLQKRKIQSQQKQDEGESSDSEEISTSESESEPESNDEEEQLAKRKEEQNIILEDAIKRKDLLTAFYALRKGADVNTTYYFDQTILRLAVETDKPGIVKAILDADNLNRADVLRALRNAIKDNKLEIIKLLLTWKDPYIDYSVALIDAVKMDKLEIIKLLLDEGASPNFNPVGDDTALDIALINNKEDFLNEYIRRIPDINVTNRHFWSSLLPEAAQYGRINIVQQLIDKGLDVNAQDHKGNTTLHYAVLIANEEKIKKLLEQPNINLTIQNNKGETAFDLASPFIKTLIAQRLKRFFEEEKGRAADLPSKGLDWGIYQEILKQIK